VTSLPANGQWTRLSVLAKSIGINSASSVSELSIKVVDGEAWIDKAGKSACTNAQAPAPQYGPNEQVWFDDDFPSGATAGGVDSFNSGWTWSTTQIAGGTRSHQEPLRSGNHQHYFDNAKDLFAVSRSDVLFTYVYLDPCNPPRMVMLQWDGGDGWEHRAYWGDNLSPWGSDNTGSRWRMGPLPELGKWVRLEVPAPSVSLAGRTVIGMSFGIYDGQAWFDRAGKVARANVAFGKTATQSSNYPGDYPAAKAVDGSTASGGTNMSITNFSTQPWWQVDLGAVYPLDQVNIYGRTDCCQSQTGNFYLQLSDVPFASNTLNTNIAQADVSSYGIGGTASSLLTMTARRTARYVRIHMAGSDNLSIPEVEAFTPAGAQRVNLAGGRTATSSSIWDSWTHPTFAVNGTANQPYQSGGSIFHIRNGGDTEPWWQLDLGAVSPISTIDVWTRADTPYMDQSVNLFVIVSDAPFTSQSLAPTIAQAGVSVYYTGATPHAVLSIPVNRTGRYVRIQKAGTAQSFSLGEVEVWGQQPVLQPYSKSPATGANQ
jgi:hypothetical protein